MGDLDDTLRAESVHDDPLPAHSRSRTFSAHQNNSSLVDRIRLLDKSEQRRLFRSLLDAELASDPLASTRDSTRLSLPLDDDDDDWEGAHRVRVDVDDEVGDEEDVNAMTSRTYVIGRSSAPAASSSFNSSTSSTKSPALPAGLGVSRLELDSRPETALDECVWLHVELRSNWGHASRVGLTEIQLFARSSGGEERLLELGAALDGGSLRMRNVADEAGDLSSLFNGKCKVSELNFHMDTEGKRILLQRMLCRLFDLSLIWPSR